MLAITGVTKRFAVAGAFGSKATSVTALSDVSVSVAQGKTLGIVGESGCGKTTLARIIAGQYQPDEGEVRINGLMAPDAALRSRLVSMVFQDPYAAMDDRQRVDALLAEAMTTLGLSVREMHERAVYAMRKVGLPQNFLLRFPHELSGGQRQRVCIAAALAQAAQLIVLDEPTSALDAVTSGEILSLLKRLQDESGLTYVFISHDLRAVGALAHDIAVMKDGRIVERGACAKILKSPATACTKELVAASAYRDIIDC